MELNLLVRGQSNALLLMETGNGAALLKQEVERLLGFDGGTSRVNLVYGHDNASRATAWGGTALLGDWLQPVNGDWHQGWTKGWMEQALLNWIGTLPAGQRHDPTAVLWLHSEYDSMRGDLSEAMWTNAVRHDAALVRAAFGQSAAELPYYFVSAHPYSEGTDAGHVIIRAGMEALTGDAGFNAAIAARALDIDADRDDQDGNPAHPDYGGGHISGSDAALIALRAARSIAEGWAEYARPGSPLAASGGDIANEGPEVVAAHRYGANGVELDIRHDHANGFQVLDAEAQAGTGWTLHMADGSVNHAVAAFVIDVDTVRLFFAAPLGTGEAALHYGWGYGRLAADGQPGQGNAIYDTAGLPIWTPAHGTYLPALQDSQAGGPGNDLLIGSAGRSTLHGGGGADTLVGGAGDDLLDGGAGDDVVVLAGPAAHYVVAAIANGYVVHDITGLDGTDLLYGIETVVTADGVLALDAGAAGLFKVSNGAAYLAFGSSYAGPVAGLERSYIGNDGSEAVGGTLRNDFINALGGDDAIDAGAGEDVVDGGSGSNFLTGGAGHDVFFLDGRALQPVWSTIADWEAGEQLSLWGWRPGVSQARWAANDGADGYRGATLHADLDGDGATDASITWSGLDRGALPQAESFDGLLWFH